VRGTLSTNNEFGANIRIRIRKFVIDSLFVDGYSYIRIDSSFVDELAREIRKTPDISRGLHKTHPPNLSSERLLLRLVAIAAGNLAHSRRIRLEWKRFYRGSALGALPSAGAAIRVSGLVLRTRLIVIIHLLLIFFALYFFNLAAGEIRITPG